MSTWPDNRFMAVDRFVRQVRARHPLTRLHYRFELQAFQQFIYRCAGRAVTEKTVIAWIQARSEQLRPITIADRSRKVSRFLDFLVRHGALAENPFATMRVRYGLHGIAPIVRAATTPDPHRTLEAQRAPVPWASPLGSMMRDHIRLMRSVGFRYVSQEQRYLAFDRFLQRRPDLAGQPLRTMIQAWAAEIPTPEHGWQCWLVGRLLSRAWHRLDPRVEVLQRDPGLCAQLARQRRRPHIYTQDDMRRVLDVARQMSRPRSPLLPATAYMMVVLAYCAGLRIGEIVALTLGDVRLGEDVLEIRNTKFYKSRRVPLDASVSAALHEYLAARRRAGGPTHETSRLFWHEARASGYSRAGAHDLLIDVLRRAGLKPARGRTGPRVHDMRHSLVAHRMLTWYRDGINPQARLPYLATYLGHKDINSTLVYLTVTHELLQIASQRFRAYAQRESPAARRRQP
jgi:integrase/recombinase XerD